MSWRPEIPAREEMETNFPRDVFQSAQEALDKAFWLDLPEERQDRLMQQGGDVEEQLEELVLVWRRLGQDRIDQLQALRDSQAIRDEINAGFYNIGIEDPELDEAHAREHAADTAVRLDYKSFFVFADILVGGYIRMGEMVWEPLRGSTTTTA